MADKSDKKKDAPAARPGVLKVHHLRPVPGANTAKTRVGRGEGSKGKTAGRGTKGTKARYQVKAGFEGGQMPLHMRTPKLRGFKNPFRVEYQVVNLDKLAELEERAADLGVHPDIAGFDDLAHAFDLYGSLLAARATLECAIERRETRGCHNRSDFPAQDDALRGSFVWTPDGGVVFEPVADAPDSFRDLAHAAIDSSVEGKLVE